MNHAVIAYSRTRQTLGVGLQDRGAPFAANFSKSNTESRWAGGSIKVRARHLARTGPAALWRFFFALPEFQRRTARQHGAHPRTSNHFNAPHFIGAPIHARSEHLFSGAPRPRGGGQKRTAFDRGPVG
jgi:hypothetical protein